MTTLFDHAAAIEAKETGMKLAADNRPSDLDIARQVARRLALSTPDRTTHADEVGRVLAEDFGIRSLGPAAGSLFKGGEWAFTGQRILSARRSNHARELKIWRLVR